MNETAFPRIAPFLSLLVMLILGACSPDTAAEPPLKGATIGGPFTLTDQNGEQVSNSDFDGRYRLIYFGYTYCPDVCPVDLQAIGQGLRQFEKSDPQRAERVQPIFISVDPDRDTPSVLKDYVAAFHPRLIGLTGSEEQIAAVSKQYGVYSAPRAEEGATDYLVDHSRTAILFGPEGKPIAILPHEEGADAIAAELDRWVE